MKIFSIAIIVAFTFPFALPLTGRVEQPGMNKPGAVFTSADGGKTWQDISKGLPENVPADCFANETSLYLRAGKELYYTNPNGTAPIWKKEAFLLPAAQESLAPGKAGMYAYNTNGNFLQHTKGAGAWQPLYPNFPGKEVRSVFETLGGSVFIITGFWKSSSLLHKSTDGGNTWKPLLAGDMITKMVEANGVLLATGSRGILRSTDDGETWETVISEGGLGMGVERIHGGFAAITFNAESRTSRLRTSHDGGKTWQPIDAGLPASYNIYSLIQVEEAFFCSHPQGIYKSTNKGKTWKLLVAATDDNVFDLYVSGKVLYAITRVKGC